jgi:hypothetical protein
MPIESVSGQPSLPPFGSEMTSSLAAIFDTIIPPGEFPRSWAGGVKLPREHLEDFLPWYLPDVQSAISSLDQLSVQRHAHAFQDVSIDERTAILAELVEVGAATGEDRTWSRAYRMDETCFGPVRKNVDAPREIPHAKSRVSIDPSVRDRFGTPVARLRGEAHPASVKAAEFMRDRCVEWLTELQGDYFRGLTLGPSMPLAWHGWARIQRWPPAIRRGKSMARRTSTSWTLSCTPNGGLNPALTVLACALRVAPFDAMSVRREVRSTHRTNDARRTGVAVSAESN